MTAAAAGSSLPVPLRIAGIAAAALLLTGFFAYLRFPYDRLADAISARLAEHGGLHVDIGRLAASPQLGGPGLLAEDVRVAQDDGNVLRIDRLRLRPAWSLSWLMARPALRLAGESTIAKLDGVMVLRGPQRFTGTLQDVDLAEIPGAELLAGARFEGRAGFDVDLALAEGGPEGPVQINAREGVLSHPRLPMAVPYEELTGSLAFGGETWLQILSLDVRSPLGTGSISGTIGRAPDPAKAPLALEITVQVSPEIRGSLAAQGVQVGRDGQLRYRVTGTASAPVVR